MWLSSNDECDLMEHAQLGSRSDGQHKPCLWWTVPPHVDGQFVGYTIGCYLSVPRGMAALGPARSQGARSGDVSLSPSTLCSELTRFAVQVFCRFADPGVH